MVGGLGRVCGGRDRADERREDWNPPLNERWGKSPLRKCSVKEMRAARGLQLAALYGKRGVRKWRR